MKLKNKTLSRLLCVILTFVMMCTSAISVSATTTDDCLIPVEVNSLSDEYVIPTETNLSVASINSGYGVGRWYMNPFSFTGTNGGSYRTFYGTRMRMCIAFKATDSIDFPSDMRVSCYGYDEGFLLSQSLCAGQDEPDADGYRYYVLPWVNINYGGDYRFTYDTYTCFDLEMPPRTVHCYK